MTYQNVKIMQTLTHPLHVASDISETVTIHTDDARNSSIRTLLNEFGEMSFDVLIEVKHKYYGGDASTGDTYDFYDLEPTVTLVNVFDADGEVVEVTGKRKIERLLEQNLEIEILKKY